MTTRDITLIAMFTALLVASQLAFSMVMGINLVFPLFIIFTYNLGWKKTLIILIAFNVIEFFVWGYIITIILYTWTFLIMIVGAYMVKKMTKSNEYFAAGYTFIFFILFGLFSAIQEAVLTDVVFYPYWIQGLPSDFLGAIAGFTTTLLLLKPLTKVINMFVDSKPSYTT